MEFIFNIQMKSAYKIPILQIIMLSQMEVYHKILIYETYNNI